MPYQSVRRNQLSTYSWMPDQVRHDIRFYNYINFAAYLFT
jgi:hypothetical protein